VVEGHHHLSGVGRDARAVRAGMIGQGPRFGKGRGNRLGNRGLASRPPRANDEAACGTRSFSWGGFRMNGAPYRRPVALSDPGRHAALFDGLPRDPGALAKIVQGLLIHRYIAPAYGVTLRGDQYAQSHIRALEKILDDITTRDGRPLSVMRPAG